MLANWQPGGHPRHGDQSPAPQNHRSDSRGESPPTRCQPACGPTGRSIHPDVSVQVQRRLLGRGNPTRAGPRPCSRQTSTSRPPPSPVEPRQQRGPMVQGWETWPSKRILASKSPRTRCMLCLFTFSSRPDRDAQNSSPSEDAEHPAGAHTTAMLSRGLP